jgi:glycosyltransferase involved in cell wall biosynthesis
VREVLTVSAVIPAYNSAATLARAIDSVLRQTVPAQVIVVDDGSTDDTSALLQSYGSRISVIRQQNGGAGAARSAGTKAARTDLIAYLDADDAWHPDKLERQLGAFGDPEVGLCGAAAQWIDETGAIVRVWRPALNGYLTRELLARNFITTSSAVVRRTHIERVSPLFKPELFPVEDWEFWIRLSTVCKIIVSPEVLVDYYVLASSGTRTRSVADFKRLYSKVIEQFRSEPGLSELVQSEDRRIRANLHFFAAYLYYEEGSYRSFLTELFHSAWLAPLSHPWANSLAMLLLPRAGRARARRFVARLRHRPLPPPTSGPLSGSVQL